MLRHTAPVCLVLVLAAGGCRGSSSPGTPNVADVLRGSRWWIDAGGEGQLVVHWTDGRSRALDADRAPAPGVGGPQRRRQLDADVDGGQSLYVARTTDDPDALGFWTCATVSRIETRLGLLRRGPPLIREIPYDEQPVTSANGQQTLVTGDSFERPLGGRRRRRPALALEE